MKKLLVLLMVLLPMVVWAQSSDDAAPPFIPPDWLATLMIWIQGMPVVGPILIELMKWAGFLSASLTALAAFLMSLGKALSQMQKISGLAQYAQKGIELINKVLPYVAYLSMFNVQHPPKPEAIVGVEKKA